MLKKQLVVGMPGFLNSEGMFGVTGHYINWLNTIGNPRIIMPWEEFVEVDLLVLPGGLDLTPSTYGQIPNFKTSNHDVFKEFFFNTRLQNYIDAGVPIFGICLGFQMLNVKLGGTLTQHIYNHQNSDRGRVHHKVKLTDYQMKELTDKGKETGKVVPYELGVNSHHHQAVFTHNLAEGLSVGAFDEYHLNGDTIVEAFIHDELPIAGVQWHPEEIHDWYSQELVNIILKRAGKLEPELQEDTALAM